ALERTESRGAHTREDHPEADPDLGRLNILVREEGGTMVTATEAVPEPPEDLRRLIEEGV
ncbi:MAG: hypothetical protein R3266_11895, partial [Gemmatimonadota bacterium]|nr:hypothetical protein [Gemmatimonadota bacterium]